MARRCIYLRLVWQAAVLCKCGRLDCGTFCFAATASLLCSSTPQTDKKLLCLLQWEQILFSSTQAAECTIIVYKLSLPYRTLCGVFEFFILVSSHSCSLVFDGIFWWSSLSLITPASVMLQKYEVTITSFNEVVASCMFANSESPAERILHPSQK